MVIWKKRIIRVGKKGDFGAMMVFEEVEPIGEGVLFLVISNWRSFSVGYEPN